VLGVCIAHPTNHPIEPTPRNRLASHPRQLAGGSRSPAYEWPAAAPGH
jgi:hypothetical protein